MGRSHAGVFFMELMILGLECNLCTELDLPCATGGSFRSPASVFDKFFVRFSIYLVSKLFAYLACSLKNLNVVVAC